MTTLVTTAGPVNVLTHTTVETLVGAWTSRIEVDSDDEITGPVVLTEGLTTWAGVKKRGAQEHGRTIAQLVGGTGGLSSTLRVLNYHSPRIADILADIMTDAGEVPSPDISAATLLSQTERWSRRRQPGGLSVKQLADEAGADHWRILRDGTVWFGTESWPEVPSTFDYTEISRDPSNGTITIAPEEDQILVAAGDKFLGRNVAGVVTVATPGTLRQTISWEDEHAPGDRLLGPLKSAVEAFVAPRIDYAKQYPSIVNSQNADGSLDITPDDESIRGDGFQSIQISHGLPGVEVTVPSGGRVNLYFQNGDPKQPRAGLWEGSGITEMVVGSGAEPYMKTETFLTALNTLVTAVGTFATAGAAVRASGGDATLGDACTAFTLAPLQTTFKSTTIKGE